MTTFSADELRREPEAVLQAARSEGEVRIKGADGQEYAVRPVTSSQSPFEIAGVDTGLGATEIVRIVREVRERRP